MENQGFQRSRLISSFLQIPHGNLSAFTDVGLEAAKSDTELLAHFVAWNHKNGKVRDGKKAFPILSLRHLTKEDRDIAENAVAHLLLLDPRDLTSAYRYNKELSKKEVIHGGWRNLLQQGLNHYLETREHTTKWWDRSVLSSRKAMTELYTVAHRKPSSRVQEILFNRTYPKGSIFTVVGELKNMTPELAAQTILKHKIPFQVAIGAAPTIKHPDVVFALIEGMSGNELVNNTAMLRRLGAFESPTLKGAYEKALERAKGDKKVNTYKASKAAAGLDEETKKKVLRVQESHEAQMKKIPGDWVILVDKSGSMKTCIELGRKIAAAITTQIEGKSYLLFFDATVHKFMEISGKTYEQIYIESRRVPAAGGTSIGIGMNYLHEKNIIVNGIAIVSDGGEHGLGWNLFPHAYRAYCNHAHVEPSVYLFHVPGDPNYLAQGCAQAGIDLTQYEASHVDEYSLPNLIRALKPGRFGLVDEVMETPLLTLNDALKKEAAQ